MLSLSKLPPCPTMRPGVQAILLAPTMSWPDFKSVWLTWIQVHLMEWVREVVATTLGVAPSGQLPPIIMQREVPSIWDQIRKLSAVLVSHTVCCQPAVWRQLECNQGPRNASISRLIDCASHPSSPSVQLITSILKKWQERVLLLLRVLLLSQQC